MNFPKPFFSILLCVFASVNIIYGNPDMPPSARKYIDTYKGIAISEMHRTGIPASIKLAQGLLESNWGRSDLARLANNHFGIKCSGNWEGETFYKEDDDKDEYGNIASSCFRVFNSVLDSYVAHSEFLTSEDRSNRYGFLFDHGKDYRAWAVGLRKAGYASDPQYPKKLINIIKKYDLDDFDKIEELDQPILAAHSKKKPKIQTEEQDTEEDFGDSKIDRWTASVADFDKPQEQNEKVKYQDKPKRESIKHHGNSRTSIKKVKAKKVSQIDTNEDLEENTLHYPIRYRNALKMVKAKGGETIEMIATSVGVEVSKIMEYNENFNHQYTAMPKGLHVFLEKKNRDYHGDGGFHELKEGETMFDVAQKYGIRLSSLYAKNRISEGSQPVVGSKISLIETLHSDDAPLEINTSTAKNAEVFLF